MDHPPPAPLRSSPAWLRTGLVALAVVLVAGYGVFLTRYTSPYAAGADSSGYLNSARLMSQGKFFTAARALPGHTAVEFGEAAYQPLGFLLQAGNGRMAPTYPIGLPLHLLAAAGIAGWARAGYVVNLLAVLASGGLLWVFARRLGLARVTAAAGVIVLWLCPLFLFSAFQPMSDLLALVWSMAALYAAWRAREELRWGFLAGIALSLAVLVRPTNVLLAVPLLVALGGQWRSYLAVGVGGLPGAALLMFYNWKVYGSPITTGYGDVRSAFSTDYLGHNLLHFARWIPVLLTPLVVGGLLAPFLPRARQRGFAVLATWAGLLIGFYAFYYHSGETWWYLRFILPAFPALLLAALLAWESIAEAAQLRRETTIALGSLLLLLSAGWLVWQDGERDIFYVARNERSYPDASHWAQKNLPANTALFCMQVSGALYYYTDFILLRWDQITPEKYGPLLQTIAGQGRPVYAALYEFETAEAQQRIGGHWTKLATVGQVTFWQRQP